MICWGAPAVGRVPAVSPFWAKPLLQRPLGTRQMQRAMFVRPAASPVGVRAIRVSGRPRDAGTLAFAEPRQAP